MKTRISKTSKITASVLRKPLKPLMMIWRFRLKIEHSDKNETRFALIGMCEIGLVFISFTFRDENYRIISARKASRKMEKMYADND